MQPPPKFFGSPIGNFETLVSRRLVQLKPAAAVVIIRRAARAHHPEREKITSLDRGRHVPQVLIAGSRPCSSPSINDLISKDLLTNGWSISRDLLRCNIFGTKIASVILPEIAGARADETHHPFSGNVRLLDGRGEWP
jgi:hypothetical protein